MTDKISISETLRLCDEMDDRYPYGTRKENLLADAFRRLAAAWRDVDDDEIVGFGVDNHGDGYAMLKDDIAARHGIEE